MKPSYLRLYKNGDLAERVNSLLALLEKCCLCPRKCGVNRLKNEKGYCKTGRMAKVYSYMPHFGEEPPISGSSGSGTIFFSGCNMSCVYCQNYKFSQLNKGKVVNCHELAQFMLELQKLGCHNINLVTPTHVIPQILEALLLAVPLGLKIPLVYNTSGYELPEVIHILDGIIDIFLSDIRYFDPERAKTFSNAENYPKINQSAVIEMFKQSKTTIFDKNCLLLKGIVIRVLILPGSIAETEKILRFIAKKLSSKTYISLMSQYLPCYKAKNISGINKRITEQEYNQAQEIMFDLNLLNGWVQESKGMNKLAGINIKLNLKS